jgi:hypothetical protein
LCRPPVRPGQFVAQLSVNFPNLRARFDGVGVESLINFVRLFPRLVARRVGDVD